MSKNELSPMQRSILLSAGGRADRSLHPFPPGLKGGAIRIVCESLVRKGLAAPWGDGPKGGWLATDAGLAAVGFEVDPSPSSERPREGSKLALLVSMLERPEGAGIDELADATGWQRHTVRGTMSGAIKGRFGMSVVSAVGAAGKRVYRIDPAPEGNK